jgi:ketosteroid isomerase-like protein
MLDALDRGDVDGFCEPLHDDCAFVYANSPPVEGRESIRGFVQHFVESIETSDHRVDEVYGSPGRVVARGEVTYTKRDGSELEAPFVDVFEMEDGEVSTYQVYVDSHELDL